ncbi:MAG: uracil phosphoribosyltransferase [Gemmataceae bacterium]|nr:uracil phosphoribosyltransferase [Planctomycetia bacterium]MBX3397569.1 uracil phosphoribosyltransferase [Gemmataceae bacterium]
MAAVHVSSHPLLVHKLAKLRAHDTPPPIFRELVYEISQVLFYEATRDVPLRDVPVRTPLVECVGKELDVKVGLVPVLRAGLGMANAMLDALPEAAVWHIGLYRDHATLKPVTYYNKLPAQPVMGLGIVLDPMLATGGSAIEAIRLLKQAGTPQVRFIGLIAAPEGVAALQAAHPDVDIYLAAVDSHLNELGYIVPGLGDAGDRQFGTT